MFKVGDKVILIRDTNYSVTRKGWMGIVRMCSGNDVDVAWEKDSRFLPVDVEDLKLYKKIVKNLPDKKDV